MIGGDVFIESSGNPSAIDIYYEGVINAESDLPEGFFATEANNRIIIIRFSNKEIEGPLFSYIGDFILNRAEASVRLNSLSLAIINSLVN